MKFFSFFKRKKKPEQKSLRWRANRLPYHAGNGGTTLNDKLSDTILYVCKTDYGTFEIYESGPDEGYKALLLYPKDFLTPAELYNSLDDAQSWVQKLIDGWDKGEPQWI